MSQPPGASPHRVVFVADPQIVDPHTYPGRPWPLSVLTVRYTDLYLRKSFQLLQARLRPDTVIFLGDLFDGGREWSTSPSASTETKSPDKRWNKYGEKFWLKEYNRFGGIFLNPWVAGTHTQRENQRGRKIIAELPGNHDLGFGLGIRLPVRQRFNAYFGAGNRVDVIGNFTFVSIDTVSLSANGQPDPATGSQGAETGDQKVQKLWSPTEIFLSEVKDLKSRMINQELRYQAKLPEYEPQDHTVSELIQSTMQKLGKNTIVNASIPSILLTHVPLYRALGTPCGPLRERYPPTQSSNTNGEILEKDNQNALPLGSGIQYQTVLTPAISSELIDKIGDVEAVFSGDDHDYCDVVHRGYTSKNGGIREITVKAMSWAAGIRKPGFLMLSLWNPLDADDKLIKAGTNSKTLEPHLCLLPDQLSIFARYAFLFLATLIILLFRACISVYSHAHTAGRLSPNHPLLPITKQPPEPNAQAPTSSATHAFTHGLAARSSAAFRTRSASPLDGYNASPSVQEGAESAYGRKAWKSVRFDDDMDDPQRRSGKGLGAVWRMWTGSIKKVVGVVLLWYFWLLWDS